jgi:hypothetical protein
MSKSKYRELISTTTEVPGVALTRGRLLWPDDTFSDFASLRFPADRLTLRDIDQRDPAPKLHMLGHLRLVKAISFGRTWPRVITWLRLAPDQLAEAILPGISTVTATGETILSANSLITYALRQMVTNGWLKRQAGEWHLAAPNNSPAGHLATAVLAFLQREDRLHMYTGPWPTPADDDLSGVHPIEDVIPIDQLGYVRELVWHENPLAAFNTAYFLLEHNDFISHHSGLGEPYNLFVENGLIQRPAIYRRSTLYQKTDGGWEIGMFGLADLELIPGDFPQPLPFAVDEPAAITAYTRRWAIADHGRVIGSTPEAPERQEFTIIDTRVVGSQQGGKLEIPQNGFVLSFAPEALPATVDAALRSGRVRYRFRAGEYAGIRQAVQAGPRLLNNADVCLSSTTLRDEAFWPDRPLTNGEMEMGVVPSEYPDDVDITRAGRVGVGVDTDGQMLVTAIIGSETRGVKDPRLDSAGATLVELANLMAEMGAVKAVNMDGGGSTQIFFLSGLATTPGGRLGLQSVQYERLVPSVGVVS